MAWRSRTNWVNTEKPQGADINNLGLDIRTWGASAADGSHVNANGNHLTGLAQLHGYSNVLGIYTNSVERLNFGSTGILTRSVADAQTALLTNQLQEVLSFKNTNTTVNNWMTLTFYSSSNAAAASISSQMISHASSYADIVLATRGADGYQIRARVLSSGHVVVSSGKLRVSGIPTSAAGLASGDVWSNSGVLTIVA